ncbi:nuclear transport factor 2 family protein [Pontiella agarivorans]|uniref:nuclear transport factor 2 family protein n=1 Tax=Pontiella agarivorans TaxID=3038953 RepID=UPI002AD4AD2C|nr:nuclear transport factor 2 family protein [Pontiella agarivorans]
MIGALTMTGCTSQSKDRSPDWSRNTAKVQETADLSPMDAATEKKALKRFTDFYAEYSYDAIKEGVRGLYADEAWFGDPFHIVEGIDNIEHYFLVMAEPVESCTFTVDSIQRSGIDYFARWTMELESKAAQGEQIKTIGISQVRFNRSGKIVFQQDYWDATAMMDRLPIVGYWTRLVKDRIEKGLEK